MGLGLWKTIYLCCGTWLKGNLEGPYPDATLHHLFPDWLFPLSLTVRAGCRFWVARGQLWVAPVCGLIAMAVLKMYHLLLSICSSTRLPKSKSYLGFSTNLED